MKRVFFTQGTNIEDTHLSFFEKFNEVVYITNASFRPDQESTYTNNKVKSDVMSAVVEFDYMLDSFFPCGNHLVSMMVFSELCARYPIFTVIYWDATKKEYSSFDYEVPE